MREKVAERQHVVCPRRDDGKRIQVEPNDVRENPPQ